MLCVVIFFSERSDILCVYFSGIDSGIIQIAVRDFKISSHFVRFVSPYYGFISSAVSKLTGIKIHELTFSTYIMRHAVDEFLARLKKYKSLLFVAHNGKFDACILVSTICKS